MLKLRPVFLVITLSCIGMAMWGCSSKKMEVFPAYTKSSTATPTISGRLAYNGNYDYLPGTIAKAENGVNITYKTEVEYNSTGQIGDFFRAFIPTTIVGTPIGSKALLCGGVVTIVCADGSERKYSAASSIRKSTSIFEGSDMTALRREGLLSVRENLESQMANDTALLGRCMQPEE